MKPATHWQDYGNVVLGLWLLFSPLVLGFEAQTVALWNTVGVALLLLATAVGAALVPMAWEDWTETALGAWLVICPLFLDFQTQIGAANSLMSGLLVLTLSLWALEDQAIAERGAGPHSVL